MMKNNNIKLGLGLVVALSLGGCTMDGGYSNSAEMERNATVAQGANAEAKQPVQKTYATKDPVQKSVPGPKRAAAPTLPVIQ